jgi:3-oxoacyl-[acyl-carrier protein] reductase
VSFSIDLTGRRALVTGAGRHTGRLFAHALAAAGAEVAVNDMVAEQAKAVCDEISRGGGAAVPLVFDVTDYAQARDAVGPFAPDILVNNAGGTHAVDTRFPRFVDTQPAAWHPHVAVNMFGVFNCTHVALRAMLERGWGRVITIISDAARRAEPGLALYAAAKAGAAGFMRSIAAEVGRDGVTANCISLGSLAYAHETEPDPERIRRLLRNYAIKRRGTPSDPVGLLILLASDHSAWITGQVIPVNGGYSSAL